MRINPVAYVAFRSVLEGMYNMPDGSCNLGQKYHHIFVAAATAACTALETHDVLKRE